MANRRTVYVQTNGLLLFLDLGNELDMVFLLFVIPWDDSSGRLGTVIEGERRDGFNVGLKLISSRAPLMFCTATTPAWW